MASPEHYVVFVWNSHGIASGLNPLLMLTPEVDTEGSLTLRTSIDQIKKRMRELELESSRRGEARGSGSPGAE